MNANTAQIALAQLAMLTFSTMVVISQPKFAYFIAINLGLGLAYSVGTAFALIKKFHLSDYPETKKHNAATLGTLLGGALCYIILLEHLFDYI